MIRASVVFLAAPILWAQIQQPTGLPKRQAQLTWNVSDDSCVLVDENRQHAQILAPKGSVVSISFPGDLRVLSWASGRFFAIRPDAQWTKVDLFSSEDGRRFDPLGHFVETTKNVPLDFLVPLRKANTFLGGCMAFGFVKDGVASLLGVFRLKENGELVLDGLPDLQLEHPLFRIGTPKPGESFVTLRDEYSSLASFLAVPIQTQNHILLVSTRSGIIWVLDRENGSVRHVVKLYKLEEKDLGSKSDIEDAILCIHPTREGKVLIAARDETAFRFSRQFYKYSKTEKPVAAWEEASADHDSIDDPRFRSAEAQRATETFGDLIWWELDPETGKVERTYPEGVPSKLQTPQALNRFRFLIGLDGKVKTNSSNTPPPSK